MYFYITAWKKFNLKRVSSLFFLSSCGRPGQSVQFKLLTVYVACILYDSLGERNSNHLADILVITYYFCFLFHCTQPALSPCANFHVFVISGTTCDMCPKKEALPPIGVKFVPSFGIFMHGISKLCAFVCVCVVCVKEGVAPQSPCICHYSKTSKL